MKEEVEMRKPLMVTHADGGRQSKDLTMIEGGEIGLIFFGFREREELFYNLLCMSHSISQWSCLSDMSHPQIFP